MKNDEEERLAVGCFITAAAAFFLAFVVIIELIVRTIHG